MIRNRYFRWTVVALLLLVAGIIFVVTILLPSVRALRRADSMSHLQHIEYGLTGYRDAHGSCPPQYLTDRQGTPAHSWRVLILPYLGYDDLYRRYRFDEPWNGPHNRLLATEMPKEYRSPYLDSHSTITPYVGIAGKDTPWQGATAVQIKNVERTDSKIWFVEAANSDIHWMEPRDISLEQASIGINVPGGRGIQSNYLEMLPAEMLPFGKELVPTGISPDKFRAMLTTPALEKERRTNERL